LCLDTFVDLDHEECTIRHILERAIPATGEASEACTAG
jgi:hypothetical protein